jgi:HK97 family phage portal protein
VSNRTTIPLSGVGSKSIFRSIIEGGPSRSKKTQMEAYGEVGTLFAIVDRISEATSKTEWSLYRKSVTGDKDDREQVLEHAALNLWNEPNPFMFNDIFVESCQQHKELTGEYWWLIVRSPRADVPLELWPVRPDRIEPVPHPTKFISGYVYHGPEGEKIPLNLNEIIYDRKPNPLDPTRGMAPIQSVMTEAEAAKYSSLWIRSFFYNSAEPGGIIEVDKRLGDTEFRELRSRWDEQHRGVHRAHRVAILEQGKWVDRKFTMREMQMSDIRIGNRESIREAYGYPKPMLGTVEDVNRANAEAAEIMFTRWLQVPRLDRLRAILNFKMLPLFGEAGRGLEFDYRNPVPVNVELQAQERRSKAEGAQRLVIAGYDPDDVADAMELPRMKHIGITPATTDQSWSGGESTGKGSNTDTDQESDDDSGKNSK